VRVIIRVPAISADRFRRVLKRIYITGREKNIRKKKIKQATKVMTKINSTNVQP